MADRGPVETVIYGQDNPVRQTLDVWYPASDEPELAVMVIHGGGLRSLDRHRMAGVAGWLATQGYLVINLGYRLVQDAPYPAAIDDILSAHAWSETHTRGVGKGLVLLGASAGGFLAMTAAARLPAGSVAGVVSISGPTGRYPTEQGLPVAASAIPADLHGPIDLLTGDYPPLLTIHSRQDTIVPVEASLAVTRRAESLGVPACCMTFNSTRNDHGIWSDPDQPAPRLLPAIEARLAAFLQRVADSSENPNPTLTLEPHA